MVERIARGIAAAVVANAPDGWTEAVLECTASRDGTTSVTGGYLPHVPRGVGSTSGLAELFGASVPARPRGRLPRVADELRALARALRDTHGWEGVCAEIRCRPSGEYKLVAFSDAIMATTGPGGGFVAILDSEYRLPEPGLRQRGGTAGPEGDPRLAAARMREYLRRREAILGRSELLPPGASPAELDEAERGMGWPLPTDLRALYEIANGDGIGFDHRNLFGRPWVPVMSLGSVIPGQREPYWMGWETGWDSVVFDAAPAETVRRCTGHPGWIAFASDDSGECLAVDLAPARHGRLGQVIAIGGGHHEGPAHVAGSVTGLLGRCLDLLDQGAYEVSGDRLRLHGLVAGRDFVELGGEMPVAISPGRQLIRVSAGVSPVDLAPVASAASLRLLHVNHGVTSNLAPVGAAPVESLRVSLDGLVDLNALEGHRFLASLELGTTTPIDISALRTVEGLRGLDLSRARVRDLTVVADLPDLRYLSLSAKQWLMLLDQGNQIPVTLAAARLVDTDASLDAALAWAARLGVDESEALRVSGTL